MKKTLICAAAVLAASPALAKDYVNKVEMSWGIDTGIHVNVNGSGDKYNAVPMQTVKLRPMVKASCNDGANVGDWLFIAEFDKQSGSIIEGIDQSWPHVDGFHGSSREMDWTQVKLDAPVGKLFPVISKQKNYAPGEIFVRACNDELDKRVSQGSSRFALLNSGFTTSLQHPFTYRAYCKKGDSFSADSVIQTHNLNIKCNAVPQGAQGLQMAPPPPFQPPSGPANLSIPFQVTKVVNSATPFPYNGACPVEITFKSSITATKAGTVQYRWVDQTGAKGAVASVNVGDSLTATVENVKTFGKPEGAPGNTLGMAPADKPKGVGGLSSGPGAEQGHYSGGYKVEIVSPPGPQSSLASYNVQCKKPGPVLQGTIAK